MLNVIKSNYYRMMRSKPLIICGLLMLIGIVFAVILVSFLPAEEGANKFYGVDSLFDGLRSVKFFSVIFAIFAASNLANDYQEGIMKNVFSKGVSRTKYYLGNIFSIFTIGLLFITLYVSANTVITSSVSGFGSMNNAAYFVGTVIADVLLFCASISVISMIVVAFKKSTPSILTYIFILVLPSILNLVALKTKLDVKFDCINIFYYLGKLAEGKTDIKLLFSAIAAATGYISISMCIGLIVLKKRDVK